MFTVEPMVYIYILHLKLCFFSNSWEFSQIVDRNSQIPIYYRNDEEIACLSLNKNVFKEGTKSYYWGGTAPCTSMPWVKMLDSNFAEMVLVVLVNTKLNMIQKCAHVMKTNGNQGCIQRGVASTSREVILPLYAAQMRPHLECCEQSWALQYMDILEEMSFRPGKGDEDDEGTGASFLRLREDRLEKRKIREDLVCVHINTWRQDASQS